MNLTWELTLAQQNGGGLAMGEGLLILTMVTVALALILLVVAGLWKVFTKAGQPGWAAIIPIVNLYFLLKINGRPWWWLLLLLIPIVSVVVSIIMWVELARSFGRGVLFALGLIFLPIIFIPVLGFGESEYQGPAAG